MPKKLSELKKALRGVKRAGGKKIDFKPIAQRIIESGLYYSVTEVWTGTHLVNKAVGRFRTMKLLNKCVQARRMTRLLEKGVFFYGAPESQKK